MLCSGRKALLASCARSSRTIWLKVLRFQTVLYRSHVPRRTSAERPLPRILSGRMRIFRQPGSVGGRGNYCAARCSAYCAGIQSWTCASTLSDVPIAGPSIKSSARIFTRRADSLCSDCKRRMERNPIRVLDCKTDADKLKDAPRPQGHLCADCAAHDDQVHALLKEAGVEYTVYPSLVRGLDYYSRTVFEVYARGKTESQDALAAGGRYDGLVTVLGGEPCPAVGFAVGIERVLNYLEELSAGTGAKQSPPERKVFVAALGPAAIMKSFALVNDLRSQGIPSECVLNSQSLKSQMRMADSIEQGSVSFSATTNLRKMRSCSATWKKRISRKCPCPTL